MTINAVRILTLLVTLITVVASERCKVPVPFNSELVGRRFFAYSDCYRPLGSTGINVNAKSILFNPFYAIRYSPPFCEEKYVFHFRSDRKDPFVVYFPKLDVPGGFDSTHKETTKFCEEQHPKVREKYFPVGETRKKFKEAVREIIKGAIRIRDFGCIEDDDGMIVEVQGRAFTNVDLDGIVTYLLGVAYQYNFCAESS